MTSFNCKHRVFSLVCRPNESCNADYGYYCNDNAYYSPRFKNGTF